MTNVPSGKSSQTFDCMPWEAKHIAGIKFKKCDEFRSIPGIASIDCPRGSSKFVISGKPSAVDEVMRKMQTLLNEQRSNEILARYDYGSAIISARPSDKNISTPSNFIDLHKPIDKA